MFCIHGGWKERDQDGGVGSVQIRILTTIQRKATPEIVLLYFCFFYFCAWNKEAEEQVRTVVPLCFHCYLGTGKLSIVYVFFLLGEKEKWKKSLAVFPEL